MPNSLESDIVAALGEVAAESILAKLEQRASTFATALETERSKVAAKIAEVSAVQDADQQRHSAAMTVAAEQLAAAIAQRKTAQEEAKDAVKQRNQLASALTEAEARIAELEAALNPPTPPILQVLMTAYDAAVIEARLDIEAQALLAPLFGAAVASLSAGRPDIARLIISGAQLPSADLEPFRAQLIALIQQP